MKLFYLPPEAARVCDSTSEFSTRAGFMPSGTGCEDYDAVFAFEGKQMVGAFRGWREGRGVFCAGGTWVSREHRGTGLATKMWARMLREVAPKRVDVATISRAGTGLVAALKRKFPRIEWEHDRQST